jgi:hypothetical protein
MMNDPDPDVKAKAEEKRSATPQGIIETAKTGTLEQKLNLFKQDIQEEALVILAANGGKEIIGKIMALDSIPDPVWTVLLSRGRADKEIKPLLLEYPKLPDVVRMQLQGQACINCYHRDYSECKKGVALNGKGDVFSWCDNWKERSRTKSRHRNNCLFCVYNREKKCTAEKKGDFSYYKGKWEDDCDYYKSVTSNKPTNCSACEYWHNGKRQCIKGGTYSNCPLDKEVSYE